MLSLAEWGHCRDNFNRDPNDTTRMYTKHFINFHVLVILNKNTDDQFQTRNKQNGGGGVV